jgi:hypothetical protein
MTEPGYIGKSSLSDFLDHWKYIAEHIGGILVPEGCTKRGELTTYSYKISKKYGPFEKTMAKGISITV